MKQVKQELTDLDARHEAAIFLILYSLIGLDIMSDKTRCRDRRSRRMVGMGNTTPPWFFHHHAKAG